MTAGLDELTARQGAQKVADALRLGRGSHRARGYRLKNGNHEIAIRIAVRLDQGKVPELMRRQPRTIAPPRPPRENTDEVDLHTAVITLQATILTVRSRAADHVAAVDAIIPCAQSMRSRGPHRERFRAVSP